MDLNRRAPAYVLFCLLLLQAAIFARAPWPGAYSGDEPDFVRKAQDLLDGHLPRATVSLRLNETGPWGTRSDHHPLGYSLFAAAANAVAYRPTLFRYRAATAQFLIMCAVLWWAHASLQRFAVAAGVPLGRRLVISSLIGLQPWTFEYARNVLADSLTASVGTAGLLALVQYIASDGASGRRWLIAGGGLLGLTLILRPEMIVLAPVPLALAIALKGPPRRDLAKTGLVIAALWAAPLGFQVYYRWHLLGRLQIYGDFVFPERGAYEWAHSWVGTERENYDFVNSIHSGHRPSPPPPARAFASDSERADIGRAVDLAASCGCYSRAVDDILSRVAADRVREDWTTAFLGPRVCRTMHLWLNLETNEQLLLLLARMLRSGRLLILAALMALKAAVYGLAVVAVALAWVSRREPAMRVWNAATALMAGWVVCRTLLMGLVLGWGVHRYVHAAWPAMVWCAAVGWLRLAVVDSTSSHVPRNMLRAWESPPASVPSS